MAPEHMSGCGPESPGIQVVWYRRDLRIHDHEPLASAAARGPVLPLYIADPADWARADASARQWEFARECLVELQHALSERGAELGFVTGRARSALAAIADALPIEAVWTHAGDARDPDSEREVRTWCRDRGIAWRQIPSGGAGTPRGLAERAWAAEAVAPRLPAPERVAGAALPAGVTPQPPTAAALGLAPDHCPERPTGGRRAGVRVLRSFAAGEPRGRIARYAPGLLGFGAGTRLSPHLAWGTVSAREAAQAAQAALDRDDGSGADGRALRALLGRLAARAAARAAWDGPPPLAAGGGAAFDAWAEGRTGQPWIDACMRALDARGWLPHGMRAGLAGAAAGLGIPAAAAGTLLAARLVDHEPAVHWAMAARQAEGRRFDPVETSRAADPSGAFLRRWVWEIEGFPGAWIHAPWRAPLSIQEEAGCFVGVDYPFPAGEMPGGSGAECARPSWATGPV